MTDTDSNKDDDDDASSVYSDELSLDSDLLFADDDQEESQKTPPLGVQEGDEWLEEGIHQSSRLIYGIMALLCLSIITITAVALYYAKQTANEEYYLAFEEVSNDIYRVTQERARRAETILHGLSRTITTAAAAQAQAQFTNPWPFVTLPTLPEIAQDLLSLGTTGELNVTLVYSPLVSDQDRLQWEQYSLQHQLEVLQDPIQPINQTLQNYIPEHIYNRHNAAVISMHMAPNGTGPYSPAWQILPVPQSSSLTPTTTAAATASTRINYNMLSNPRLANSLQASMAAQQLVTSELYHPGELFGTRPWESGLKKAQPQALLVQPVLDTLNSITASKETPKVVAHIVATIPWEYYLENIILPETRSKASVFAIIENSCSDKPYQYYLDATGITYMGVGDHTHHTAHNEMYETHVLSSYGGFHSLAENLLSNNDTVMSKVGDIQTTTTTNNTATATAWACTLTLSIHPSGAMSWHYRSSPTIAHVLAMVIFVFAVVGIIILTHHRVTDDHQRDTQAQAKRSKAIIAALFPEAIREMLFDVQGEVNVDSLGLLNSEVQKAVRKPGDGDAEDPEIERLWGKRDHYSDLHPNCTVGMVDISGFSAWSQDRDPNEVFTLLEATFNTFDRLAAKRGALKVETVGDTYIVVAGLPTPSEEHATIMAKFARDALDAFIEVTVKLEVTLGPGTSDLGLRLALASGPVMAGVIRGERARFQIFGNTVSECGRLERDGRADRIHIAKVTADLISASGHGAWVRPRKRHQANSDWESETYWLLPKRSLASLQESKNNNTSQSFDHSSTSFHLRGSITNTMTNNKKLGSGFSDLACLPITDILDHSQYTSMQHSSNNQKTGERRKSTTMPCPVARQLQTVDAKIERLVFWSTETLLQVLRRLVATREASKPQRLGMDAMARLEMELAKMTTILPELHDPIEVEPPTKQSASSVQLGSRVESQLLEYVRVVSTLSHQIPDAPSMDFEHASQVLMTMQKLLPRLADPNNGSIRSTQKSTGTDWIRKDPLTLFSLLLSTLICGMDHRGISSNHDDDDDDDVAREAAQGHTHQSLNHQLVVLERAWQILMEKDFRDLRKCIYADEREIRLFRSVLVHSVLASSDLHHGGSQSALRQHWKEAFEFVGTTTNKDVMQYRVTAVMEHLIQLVNLTEYVQHWHTYCKWSQKRFYQNLLSFVQGRTLENPADYWYESELAMFDKVVIPLVKKLIQSEVFDSSGNEYLKCALSNRRQWERTGQTLVGVLMEKHNQQNRLNETSLMEASHRPDSSRRGLRVRMVDWSERSPVDHRMHESSMIDASYARSRRNQMDTSMIDASVSRSRRNQMDSSIIDPSVSRIRRNQMDTSVSLQQERRRVDFSDRSSGIRQKNTSSKGSMGRQS